MTTHRGVGLQRVADGGTADIEVVGALDPAFQIRQHEGIGVLPAREAYHLVGRYRTTRVITPNCVHNALNPHVSHALNYTTWSTELLTSLSKSAFKCCHGEFIIVRSRPYV